MVKSILTNILYLLVGFGLGCLVLYLSKCNFDRSEPVVFVETKTDTVTHNIQVEIPKYRTKYVLRTDSFYTTVFDSIEKWNTLYVQIPDTGKIAINEYQDSIKTEDYKFEYRIETLGELIRFDPRFTMYQKKPISEPLYNKPWMVSGAVSQNASFKLGLGYRGYTVEGEFGNGKFFKQLYIGKQFNF